MAEAAYRSAILAAGKNQKKLSVGWEVLGLTKEVATRMYDEEAKAGFLSDREKMYGGQARRYDSKGNQIDKEGNFKFEADKIAAEKAVEEEKDEPASNVYECSECGFTLFVAKGREFKFYGDDFECPECGAAKDKFNGRDLDSE
jgi:rubrerythrin